MCGLWCLISWESYLRQKTGFFFQNLALFWRYSIYVRTEDGKRLTSNRSLTFEVNVDLKVSTIQYNDRRILFWKRHVSFKCVSWKSSRWIVISINKTITKESQQAKTKTFVFVVALKRAVLKFPWAFITRKNYLFPLKASDFRRLSIEFIEYARSQKWYSFIRSENYEPFCFYCFLRALE